MNLEHLPKVLRASFKRWLGSLTGAFLFTTLLSPLAAQAASPTVLIKEAYLGTTGNASDEYVVIVNSGSNAVNVTGLQVQYKSATGTAWSKKAVVTETKTLAPYGVLTFATQRPHDVALTDGLAQAGGNLRLLAASGQVLDQLAWGTGNAPEGTATKAPAASQPVTRRCDDNAHTCQDTGNNSADFMVPAAPVAPAKAPSTSSIAPAATKAAEQAAAPTSPVVEASIEITELLPDPVSPLTDTRDEYIELHNSGEAVQLTGWKLTDGQTNYALDGVQIGAGQYLALFSRDTKISLNNSGDVVSLINGAGETSFTSPNYEKSQAGKTFGMTPDGWGWLSAPTPSATNAGLLAASVLKDPKSAKGSARGKKSATSTEQKLATVAAASKEKASSTSGENDDNSSGFSWGWLLAGLGVFTIGYAVYEYRPEIISLYHRLRAKFSAGAAVSVVPKTRRRS